MRETNHRAEVVSPSLTPPPLTDHPRECARRRSLSLLTLRPVFIFFVLCFGWWLVHSLSLSSLSIRLSLVRFHVNPLATEK